MRILIYKRTHTGDPDPGGCFGCSDCMGAIRHREFDAVIGVGGIGREAQANGIAGRVNWIGVGPRKVPADKRGPEITFDRLLDFGTDGPGLDDLAPMLARRMYAHNTRHLMDDLGEQEYSEAMDILKLADDAPPSARPTATRNRNGQSKRCGSTRPTSGCRRATAVLRCSHL